MEGSQGKKQIPPVLPQSSAAHVSVAPPFEHQDSDEAPKTASMHAASSSTSIPTSEAPGPSNSVTPSPPTTSATAATDPRNIHTPWAFNFGREARSSFSFDDGNFAMSRRQVMRSRFYAAMGSDSPAQSKLTPHNSLSSSSLHPQLGNFGSESLALRPNTAETSDALQLMSQPSVSEVSSLPSLAPMDVDSKHLLGPPNRTAYNPKYSRMYRSLQTPKKKSFTQVERAIMTKIIRSMQPNQWRNEIIDVVWGHLQPDLPRETISQYKNDRHLPTFGLVFFSDSKLDTIQKILLDYKAANQNDEMLLRLSADFETIEKAVKQMEEMQGDTHMSG